MATDTKMSPYLRKHGPAVDKDLLIEGQKKQIAELEDAMMKAAKVLEAGGDPKIVAAGLRVMAG